MVSKMNSINQRSNFYIYVYIVLHLKYILFPYKYEVCSKSIKAEEVFTKTEVSNE